MSRIALLVLRGLSRRLRRRAEARAPGPETNRMARRGGADWRASPASGGSGVPALALAWLYASVTRVTISVMRSQLGLPVTIGTMRASHATASASLPDR